MSRHIIIKIPKIKDKERIFKAAREKKTVSYEGVPIRLTPDPSSETLQARGRWHEVLTLMKSKGLRPRLLYPAIISFKIDGQIKSFIDRKRLKEYIIPKPA